MSASIEIDLEDQDLEDPVLEDRQRANRTEHDGVKKERDNGREDLSTDSLTTPKTSTVSDVPPGALSVSWFVQFRCMFGKNVKLLSRWPILLSLVTFGGIASVLLAGAVGRGISNPIFPELDGCGGIANHRDVFPFVLNEQGFPDSDYNYEKRVQITRNEAWRNGWPLFMLTLGPLLHAVCAYLAVHSEHSMELLGALRSLGLRISAYWLSWYAVFVLLAIVNSLLAAITAKAIAGNVHVMAHVSFGVFFLAQWLLQVSAVSSSFFLVAVCGSRKNVMFTVALVTCMIVACCLPFLFTFFSAPYTGNLKHGFNDDSGTSGAFWGNRQSNMFMENLTFFFNETTQDATFLDNSRVCTRPAITKDESAIIKDPDEQLAIDQKDIFLGCHFNPSWPAVIYSRNSDARDGVLFFSFFLNPYFHFTSLWGNILGYTALNGNTFTARKLAHAIEDLAREALPGGVEDIYPEAFSVNWAIPQYSMISITRFSSYLTREEYINRCPPGRLVTETYDYGGETPFFHTFCNVSESYFQACPPLEWIDEKGNEYNFCNRFNNCQVIQSTKTDSPSGVDMIGYLVLLSLMYLALAMYWSQVFPGANGKSRPFYFPCQWPFKKRDGSSSTDSPGVHLNSISKSYGAMQAVKDVSFAMERGVIALLGHNGAGKTTLTHIICCDIAASSGDASIFGNSINENPDAVRNSVGLCQQDDYLWPNLSAKEHMDIYATLRGVSAAEQDDTVQKWLSSVELSDVQLQYSSAFSGGMKRRLSVALATIGKRPLITLDEPTTGMDPISRRSVWRHIDEIRKDCVVLLTTHAMDEADLLADEVAIMKSGELVAVGTPLQLKSEYGSALIFSLVVKKEQIQETQTMIQSRFESTSEWVALDAGSPGNITVRIQKVRTDDKKDSEKEGVHANDLSAFVSWIEDENSPVIEYGFSNSSLEEVFLHVTGEDLQEESSNNPAGQRRSSSCCCFCCGPPKNHNGVPVDANGDAEAARSALGASDIASFLPKLGVANQSQTIFFDLWKRTWSGCGSVVSYVVYGILLVILILMGLGFKSNDEAPIVFSVTTVFASLMLVSIIAPIYSDRAGGMFYLMRSQGMLPSSYLIGTCMYSVCVQLLYTTVLLLLLFALPIFREPQNCESDDFRQCINEYGKVQYSDPRYANVNLAVDGDSGSFRVSRSPGNIGMIFATIIVFALFIPGAVLVSAYLPGYKLTMITISMVTIASGLWPFFDYTIFDYDECEKYIESRYNCTDRTFSGNGDALEYLDCVGHTALNIQSFSCPSSKTSSLLPQFGIFRALTSVFFANLRFHSEDPNFVEQILIPNLKDASCSGDTCHFPFAHSQFWSSIWLLLIGDVLLLVLGIIIALIVTFPNRFVLTQKHRITNLLSGNIFRSQNLSDVAAEGSNELLEVTEERARVAEIMKPLCDTGDTIDLRRSIKFPDDFPPVLTHKLEKVYPALGGRPPKVALKGLDMHVPKGEVLAFLGKNGAGKSTALKILSGAHESSGGIGLVGGYDCKTERLKVFECLGYCAQFDVIWAGQSVQHHLEFFGRLKGLPRDQVTTIALSIAKAVGLGSPEVYRRLASALSGGMRRRLSIAMSLLGSPVSLILDEPTTGLDPSTRNAIWNLIGSFATESRGVIITTHMMIEADTLCNRIAIVADGELKVIGTQQYLKNEYGSGYALQLNLTTSDAANRALSFVKRYIHDGAQIHSTQAKTLNIHLPRDTELQRVFSAMYSTDSARQGHVNQFLLSQSSLEDVFIAFGQ